MMSFFPIELPERRERELMLFFFATAFFATAGASDVDEFMVTYEGAPTQQQLVVRTNSHTQRPGFVIEKSYERRQNYKFFHKLQ
jgi:hypothetical protein